MPAVTLPRGTRDLLPGEADAFEWLIRVHGEVASLYGYRPLETPIFERTEMFQRGIGAGTDVVEKEMYTFPDPKDRSLSLRPENTPAAIRAVLGAHLTQEFRPVRVRYAGPMFRYDKPQQGRYRQFWQVGCECIGERSPALDVEIIEAAWRFYEAAGIAGVLLQVNSLGDLDDRTRYRGALVAYYDPFTEQLCADCRRRLDINPLRLLDCKIDAGLVGGAPLMADYLGAESAAYFAAVRKGLRDAGIAFEINPRLVRGLDYYGHTAFEFWHASLQGAQNALGGGGRYDGLAEVLGFSATPGIGYALGVDRAYLIAAEQGIVPAPPPVCDVLVCPVEAAQIAPATELARRLRGAGITTVLDAADRKLEKKLRVSDRLGARVAIIIGPDEVTAATAGVRDLVARTQSTVAAAAVVTVVRGLLIRGGE